MASWLTACSKRTASGGPWQHQDGLAQLQQTQQSHNHTKGQSECQPVGHGRPHVINYRTSAHIQQ